MPWENERERNFSQLSQGVSVLSLDCMEDCRQRLHGEFDQPLCFPRGLLTQLFGQLLQPPSTGNRLAFLEQARHIHRNFLHAVPHSSLSDFQPRVEMSVSSQR